MSTTGGGKERVVAVAGKVVKANGKAVTIDIPTATSDAFGGVKADPATETDTLPVRIGTDGKLVTAAEGHGLTDAQIASLDGLFKIAQYTQDSSAAYEAFRQAFGDC